MTEAQSFSSYSAAVFAKKYAAAKSEKQLAQSFWRDFFAEVCGISDPLSAGIEFEYPVRSTSTNNVGFVDVLWPGIVLVEHKSQGQELDKAEKQARDYVISLEANKRPPIIIVSDFQRIRIIEIIAGTSSEFALAELPDHLQQVEAIFKTRGLGASRVEAKADTTAAELMSALFVSFEEAGYGGHEVSVFLIRILFLLFGDDTRLWKRSGEFGLFEYLVDTSAKDGTGLGGTIQELFEILNLPREKRPTSVSPAIADFPYINGGIFSEPLRIFGFTEPMREALLKSCRYDWSGISPAIFGAMFQDIKDIKKRRELGEHFTSEANILKVIGPLFLNDFNNKLRKEWDNPHGLKRFQEELSTYTFADPACGCGNFLLVAYKRIRDLELRLAARLGELRGAKDAPALDGTWLLSVRLSQFYGIEYEEWSSQIAGVAMFLAEHQANIEMEKLLGSAPDLLPLSDAPNITHGNALRLDWEELFPINDHTFIMGNPPFLGARVQSDEQKEDTRTVWKSMRGSGDLDYVSNWYLVASRHIRHSGARAAFVSTNSISQGEQPPLIWSQLEPMGIHIDFAHRSFKWTNESKNQAAVHTIIIGISNRLIPGRKELWNYPVADGAPELAMVENINAYLLSAPNILITPRSTALSNTLPRMRLGSMPNDGGFLSNISGEEAERIRKTDPVAAKYLRKLLGAEELIDNEERWCLWLEGANQSDLKHSKELSKRIIAVQEHRAKSRRAATQKLANSPALFGEIRQPKSQYVGVPFVTSENRDYLPLAILSADVIASNRIGVISDDSLLVSGILSSKIFTTWNKAVSGRLESRLNLSVIITYNNFPMPEITNAQRKKIEDAMDGILLSRSFFMTSSLADLYDATSMPPQLRQAHETLDKEVAKIFGINANASDEAILIRLFELYNEMTAGLFPAPPPTKRKKAA